MSYLPCIIMFIAVLYPRCLLFMCPHYMLFLDDARTPIVTCRFVSVVFVVALIESHPHSQFDSIHPYMRWEVILTFARPMHQMVWPIPKGRGSIGVGQRPRQAFRQHIYFNHSKQQDLSLSVAFEFDWRVNHVIMTPTRRKSHMHRDTHMPCRGIVRF